MEGSVSKNPGPKEGANKTPQTPEQAVKALLSGDGKIDEKIAIERPRIEGVLTAPAPETPAVVMSTPAPEPAPTPTPAIPAPTPATQTPAGKKSLFGDLKALLGI